MTVLPIRDTTTRDVTKKRRDTTTSGEPITVRMQPDQLKALDKRIGRSGLSRPEAVRQLLEIAMKPGNFAITPDLRDAVDTWAARNRPGLEQAQVISHLLWLAVKG